MSQIFLRVLNMSISASYIVIAVLLMRLLFKKLPKWVNVLLWGVVGLRLIFPIDIKSIFSLIPSAETFSPNIMTENIPTINTGIPILNSTLNPIIGESLAPNPGDSANPLQVLIPIISVIWLCGFIALLFYTLVTYLRLKNKVETAVVVQDNIYQSENVFSPFVLGVFKPKIYLPFSINDKDIQNVISHENAHISRKDYLWKPLGFLLLMVHWFNPLMWIAYILLCRDIEFACDEKVINSLEHSEIADYSESLLNCSVNRRMISACPLAFGEVGVKKRVKSALNYKKPTFWIIIVGILICVIASVCFLTNPVDSNSVFDITLTKADSDILKLSFEYSTPMGSYSVRYVDENEPEYTGNGSIPYDGSLGKYRILIKFGDTKIAKSLTDKFPVGEAVELENSIANVKVKRVHPNDHGFSLYVGFERPVMITPVTNEKLNVIGGKVKVTIDVLKSNSDSSLPLLFEKFPEFYGLNIDDGVTVYIWQLSSKSYYCYLVSNATKNEDDRLVFFKGITISEMRAILDYYNIGRKKVTLCPINIPISSYYYEIDDSYRQSIETRFWSDNEIYSYDPIYDTVEFDVDNDGEDEVCVLSHGFTSGLFTFCFIAYNKENFEVEYYSIFYSDHCELSFIKGEDGITKVKAVMDYEITETHLFDISVSDTNVLLTQNGVSIEDIF